MNLTLTKKTAAGTVQAVSSKSVLHRALLCAALCGERTEILCRGVGQDVLATADCLRALGADIGQTAHGFAVQGGLTAKTAILPCGESGATLRFLLPVAAALGCEAEFLCSPRLRERPILPLTAALEQHGCRIVPTEHGLRCEGQLTAGRFALDGTLSSQWISGLYFALPLLPQDSEITVLGALSSAPYVALTAAVQKQFSVQADLSVRGGQVYRSPQVFAAEGDWSNAAPFLCAGAFSAEGVSVRGLSLDSVQGDRVLVELLRQFGAVVSVCGDTVTVRRGDYRNFSVNAADYPDLVPLLALLGTAADGRTVLTGAGRLRGKESDRLQTTAQVLNALGGKVTVCSDGLTIDGTNGLRGGTVDCHNDHRIAMLSAAASLLCKEAVTVAGAECVAKSYPNFFDDFQGICR